MNQPDCEAEVPDIPMHRDSVVQDIAVTHDGVTRSATYFVENGMIHIRSEEKTYLLPCGENAPAQTVEQLLIGMVQTGQRNTELAANWSNALNTVKDAK